MKIILFTLLILCRSFCFAEDSKASQAVSIPGGDGGIGFDDVGYSTNLNRVLIPGGRTGNLALIDPGTSQVSVISGFSEAKAYGGGHGEGITSVSEGRGFLFVSDRSALKISVVDPKSRKIISSAKLASGPDYIRYVSPTGEVWVTQPDEERIEIFSLSADGKQIAHKDFLTVTGGPEALVIDASRAIAYSNLWKGQTVAIDVKTRRIKSTWPDGCEGARGLALNQDGRYVFVGCKEGKAVSLDTFQNGKIISALKTGDGVDIIDYNRRLRHLYVPGGKSATLSIVAVSENGSLSLVRTFPAVSGTHCVTSDTHAGIYVCDPTHGQILIYRDSVR